MIEVIEKINCNIAEQICCLQVRKHSLRLFGLAQPILISDENSDENSVIPAVVDNGGECRYVFSDDDYSAGCYHRIIGKTYGKTKGYGDCDFDVEVYEIMLVCWGFREQLKMSAYDFEKNVIIPSMPNGVILVSSNFDTSSVIQGEFRRINYLNKPEEFIFSTRYKVQLKFNRKCLNNC